MIDYVTHTQPSGFQFREHHRVNFRNNLDHDRCCSLPHIRFQSLRLVTNIKAQDRSVFVPHQIRFCQPTAVQVHPFARRKKEVPLRESDYSPNVPRYVRGHSRKSGASLSSGDASSPLLARTLMDFAWRARSYGQDAETYDETLREQNPHSSRRLLTGLEQTRKRPDPGPKRATCLNFGRWLSRCALSGSRVAASMKQILLKVTLAVLLCSGVTADCTGVQFEDQWEHNRTTSLSCHCPCADTQSSPQIRVARLTDHHVRPALFKRWATCGWSDAIASSQHARRRSSAAVRIWRG